MASKVTTSNVQSNDPSDNTAIVYDPGKSTITRNPSDKVSVNQTEGKVNLDDKKNPTNLELVLQISADANPTVTVNADGSITLTATANSPTTQYVVCQMNTIDPGNWTLPVRTSGGSTYRYIKGTGGGGH
jgi:hypothetical protein